jgi:hypothetical protein
MRKEGHVTKKLFDIVGYYTFAPEILIKKYGLNVASLWGKIYLYEHGNKGFCSASQDTLADDLQISNRSIRYYIKILVDDKLIIDLNPSLTNRPGVTKRYKTNLDRMFELLREASIADVAKEDDTSAEFDESSANDDDSTAENAGSTATTADKYTEYIKDNKDIDRQPLPMSEPKNKISLEPESEKQEKFLHWFEKEYFANKEDKLLFIKFETLDKDIRAELYKDILLDKDNAGEVNTYSDGTPIYHHDYNLCLKRLKYYFNHIK